MTFPFFTRRAAATMSSGRVWFSVPISSLGPHLPQFLYFSAASRRSWRVSLRAGMGFLGSALAGENGEALLYLNGAFPSGRRREFPLRIVWIARQNFSAQSPTLYPAWRPPLLR